MRKSFIFIAFLAAIAFTASAAEIRIPMQLRRADKSSTNTKVDRAPMRIPIEVTYDSEAHLVSITGPESLEVEICLYDPIGALEDCSVFTNVTFSVTIPGIHILHIEGDGWYAEGEIEV